MFIIIVNSILQITIWYIEVSKLLIKLDPTFLYFNIFKSLQFSYFMLINSEPTSNYATIPTSKQCNICI